MGKVGNSLSYTMGKILRGEIKYEELDTIYAGTCFTREEAADLIAEYRFNWKDIAVDRAKMELGKESDYKEINERADELLPQVTLEAEKLLTQLLDDKKIVQTRYRVPEGQTVDVEIVLCDKESGNDTIKSKINGDGIREVISINGQLYDSIGGFSLGTGNSNIFDNELELIANQIANMGNRRISFEFLAKKMFPQHENEIKKMFEHIRSREKEVKYYFPRKDELLEVAQQPEHTAEEIGEAIEPGAELDALKTIIDEKDKGKGSGPEGH